MYIFFKIELYIFSNCINNFILYVKIYFSQLIDINQQSISIDYKPILVNINVVYKNVFNTIKQQSFSY